MPIAIFLFVAIQLSLNSDWHLRFLGLVLAIVIAGVCVDVLMHAIWGMSLLSDHAFWHGRPRGSIPHPNDIALVPLLLPLALAGVAPQAGKLRAVSGASLVLLAFTGVLATQSRNGLLGMFIAAALWAAVTFRSRVTLGLLASGVIALALATAANLWNLQARLATFGHLGNDGRLGLWAVGTQMFRESPLLGKGNHVFSQYYPAYLSKVALPSGYSPEVAYIPWVHNLYLEALAERGIIGFMTSAWLIIAIFLAARFTMRDRTVGPFARAVIASTAALLVMGVSDLTVLKDWVVLAIALLAAVAGALGRVAKMQHHTTVTAGGARPT
jgi:O-antigen ligase